MKKQDTASEAKNYMTLALDLARRGAGSVAPNPMVGCVIVNNGAVVGTGYHGYFGGPHAEVNALASAGKQARGATMYVTLEPCNHWGKTPPCTGAIIAAGIQRVVTAMADPNPRISGNGIRQLRKSGIEVTIGALQEKAEQLNKEYIRHFRRRRAPLVTVKAAMTLDGKIATRTGDSKWITGTIAREQVHRMRSTYDAILVGINTVIRDNPLLTSHGRGKNPVRVIIDPRLRIPAGSRVLNGAAPTLIIHGKSVSAARVRQLAAKHVSLLGIGGTGNSISFDTILAKLADLDIGRILIEGGGETIARALDSGMVDDAVFFIAPKIVGGRDAVSPVEGNGIASINAALALQQVKVRRFGPDLMVSGKLEK